MNDWITTNSAAELSGYHPERIRELLREKKITGQKFGNVWMISRSSLMEYVQNMDEKGQKRGPKPKDDFDNDR